MTPGSLIWAPEYPGASGPAKKLDLDFGVCDPGGGKAPSVCWEVGGWSQGCMISWIWDQRQRARRESAGRGQHPRSLETHLGAGTNSFSCHFSSLHWARPLSAPQSSGLPLLPHAVPCAEQSTLPPRGWSPEWPGGGRAWGVHCLPRRAWSQPGSGLQAGPGRAGGTAALGGECGQGGVLLGTGGEGLLGELAAEPGLRGTEGGR